jgi:hypothetical protein
MTLSSQYLARTTSVGTDSVPLQAMMPQTSGVNRQRGVKETRCRRVVAEDLVLVEPEVLWS